AGLSLGVVVALKLFLWPIILWLAITRRFKAAAVAACSSVVVLLVPWIPLRGAGLLSYPHRLSVLSSLEAKRGFSPAALLGPCGVGWSTASMVGYALGVVLLVAAYRRRHSEEAALALVCSGALLLTPILWPNYLLVMLVPLAVLRPRFGVIWLLPAVLVGQARLDPSVLELAVFLGILAVLTVPTLDVALRRRPRPVLA